MKFFASLTVATILCATTLGSLQLAQAQPTSNRNKSKNQSAVIRRIAQDVVSIGGLDNHGRSLKDEQMINFAIAWNYLRHSNRFTSLPNDEIRLSSQYITACCLSFFGRSPKHRSLVDMSQTSWKFKNGSYTGHLSEMEGLGVKEVKTIQISQKNSTLTALVTWVDNFGEEVIVRDRIMLKSTPKNPNRYWVIGTQSISSR